MFKFSLPMKLIISSSSLLTLIALACLVIMSTSVHTSDIRVLENRSSDDLMSSTPPVVDAGDTSKISSSSSQSSTPTSAPSTDTNQHQAAKQRQQGGSDSRQRGGRLYQAHTSQQSTPLESYAAAYAAVNSGIADQSVSQLTQQSVASAAQSNAADAAAAAGAYSSFGEAPPTQSAVGASQSASNSASIARQLSANPSDPYATHSSYFASYMSPSSNEASYSGQPAGSYYAPSAHHIRQHQHQQHHHGHHPQQYKAAPQQSSLPLGYPSNVYEAANYGPLSSSYYDRMAHSSAASSPFWSASSFSPSTSGVGLMSSASHALSHWTNGFSLSEIICGLVAIAIGAVILGAPFFLIYLALMGNFSGSGTLSLTNPTSATGAAGGAAAPASGRRKRLAVFEAMNIGEQSSNKHPEMATLIDSVAKSLSPFVDLQQVSRTFKQLVSSIDKYSPVQQGQQQQANKRAKSQR